MSDPTPPSAPACRVPVVIRVRDTTAIDTHLDELFDWAAAAGAMLIAGRPSDMDGHRRGPAVEDPASPPGAGAADLGARSTDDPRSPDEAPSVLIDSVLSRFGACLVLECRPVSGTQPSEHPVSEELIADIHLGAGPLPVPSSLLEHLASRLKAVGFSVVREQPRDTPPLPAGHRDPASHAWLVTLGIRRGLYGGDPVGADTAGPGMVRDRLAQALCTFDDRWPGPLLAERLGARSVGLVRLLAVGLDSSGCQRLARALALAGGREEGAALVVEAAGRMVPFYTWLTISTAMRMLDTRDPLIRLELVRACARRLEMDGNPGAAAVALRLTMERTGTPDWGPVVGADLERLGDAANAAVIYRQCGLLEDARRTTDVAVAHALRDRDVEGAARLLAEDGRMDEAVDLLLTEVSRAKRRRAGARAAEWVVLAATYQVKLGRMEDALATLSEASRRSEARGDYARAAGFIREGADRLVAPGDPRDAMSLLLDAVARWTARGEAAHATMLIGSMADRWERQKRIVDAVTLQLRASELIDGHVVTSAGTQLRLAALRLLAESTVDPEHLEAFAPQVTALVRRRLEAPETAGSEVRPGLAVLERILPAEAFRGLCADFAGLAERRGDLQQAAELFELGGHPAMAADRLWLLSRDASMGERRVQLLMRSEDLFEQADHRDRRHGVWGDLLQVLTPWGPHASTRDAIETIGERLVRVGRHRDAIHWFAEAARGAWARDTLTGRDRRRHPGDGDALASRASSLSGDLLGPVAGAEMLEQEAILAEGARPGELGAPGWLEDAAALLHAARRHADVVDLFARAAARAHAQNDGDRQRVYDARASMERALLAWHSDRQSSEPVVRDGVRPRSLRIAANGVSMFGWADRDKAAPTEPGPIPCHLSPAMRPNQLDRGALALCGEMGGVPGRGRWLPIIDAVVTHEPWILAATDRGSMCLRICVRCEDALELPGWSAHPTSTSSDRGLWLLESFEDAARRNGPDGQVQNTWFRLDRGWDRSARALASWLGPTIRGPFHLFEPLGRSTAPRSAAADQAVCGCPRAAGLHPRDPGQPVEDACLDCVVGLLWSTSELNPRRHQSPAEAVPVGYDRLVALALDLERATRTPAATVRDGRSPRSPAPPHRADVP